MSAKSVKDIKATIAQWEELLSSTDIKDSRRITALAEKSKLQALLFSQEQDDKQDADEAKITELTTQNEQQASRITELTAENAALRSKPSEIIREKDPEHEAVRRQNTALTEALKFAGSS